MIVRFFAYREKQRTFPLSLVAYAWEGLGSKHVLYSRACSRSIIDVGGSDQGAIQLRVVVILYRASK